VHRTNKPRLWGATGGAARRLGAAPAPASGTDPAYLAIAGAYGQLIYVNSEDVTLTCSSWGCPSLSPQMMIKASSGVALFDGPSLWRVHGDTGSQRLVNYQRPDFTTWDMYDCTCGQPAGAGCQFFSDNRLFLQNDADFCSQTFDNSYYDAWVKVSEQHVTEAAVLGSEIEQLPDLVGYLKLASRAEWLKLRMTVR